MLEMNPSEYGFSVPNYKKKDNKTRQDIPQDKKTKSRQRQDNEPAQFCQICPPS